MDVQDTPPQKGTGSDVGPPAAELMEARLSDVGGMTVRRSLPKARRRTVGAWCFVDHFGPLAVEPDGGIDIGPHPHTGLSTVTYLLDGQVLHRDSLGSEQVIRPGQLNLMTAGNGLSHAEEPTGRYRGQLHGVQLWVAQPEQTRHGAPAFEHHEELPRVELPGADATVLVGSFAGATSSARADTALLGVSLDLRPGATEVALEASYEHLLVVLDGVLVLDDQPVEPGRSAYLGPGRDQVLLTAPDGARVLLLGGEPFEERIVMWWNFVGRSREEVAEAGRQWTAADDRFGRVVTSAARIPLPVT
ncbi:MAG: Pirin family protein [Frankiales bacterium]|nr:Pirin family protein [Frankiales bacterium]